MPRLASPAAVSERAPDMASSPVVVLDLRMVRGTPHGISRYAAALARHLPLVAPDLQILALRSNPAVDDAGTMRAVAPFLSPLEQVELPIRLALRRPDLFHATSFSVPRLAPCPLVVTLHDAIHLAVKEESSAFKRAYYRHIVRPAALRARALVAVSSFAQQELARHLDIPASRFTVIANGIDERFRPPAADEIARVRARHGLAERFALYVGNAKPHKNLGVVLAAARALSGRIPIVIAGEGTREAGEAAPGVHALGEVPDAELPALYAASAAFVFPSLYEGAGLPALEAMACGAPVVAARAASMPELLGDAALWFDPSDAAGLAALIERVCNDEGLRRERSERGAERARLFNWRDCAKRTADVYRRALAARGNL